MTTHVVLSAQSAFLIANLSMDTKDHIRHSTPTRRGAFTGREMTLKTTKKQKDISYALRQDLLECARLVIRKMEKSAKSTADVEEEGIFTWSPVMVASTVLTISHRLTMACGSTHLMLTAGGNMTCFPASFSGMRKDGCPRMQVMLSLK